MKTSVSALVLVICCLGFSEVSSFQLREYFIHFEILFDNKKRRCLKMYVVFAFVRTLLS